MQGYEVELLFLQYSKHPLDPSFLSELGLCCYTENKQITWTKLLGYCLVTVYNEEEERLEVW